MIKEVISVLKERGILILPMKMAKSGNFVGMFIVLDLMGLSIDTSTLT